MATKTLTPKFNTGKNPLAFTIFPEENDEGRDFIPEPPLLMENNIQLAEPDTYSFFFVWRTPCILRALPNCKVAFWES